MIYTSDTNLLKLISSRCGDMNSTRPEDVHCNMNETSPTNLQQMQFVILRSIYTSNTLMNEIYSLYVTKL